MIIVQQSPRLPIKETDNRTTAATSHATVDFGADTTDRWVVVLAFHGNTAINPGQFPTATIGGTSATRIAAHSTGDGVGTACGAAMFVAQPSGATGTVAVTWGGLSTTIIVLRVAGYNMATAHDSGAAGSTTGTFSTNIPTNGLLIGAVTKASGGISWTNLTERLEDTANSKTRSYGWNYNMALQSGRSVSYTPHSMVQGQNAAVVASFARP